MKEKKEQKKKSRRHITRIITIIIILLVIVTCGFLWLNYSRYNSKVDEYNEAVSDYNVVAQGYVELIQNTSIENVNGMPSELTYEKEIKKTVLVYLKNMLMFTNSDKIEEDKQTLEGKTEELISNYLIAQQITNPSSEWIIKHLATLEMITGTQAVTDNHDPNGFLGKEGGYTGCVYFSVSAINQDEVNGEDIIEKGTDCGGCIEIYENKEDAMIRCEYLSQFDNTLIYSGSYAIVGTMVVRTSYILSNEQQVELTNDITEVLTELE